MKKLLAFLMILLLWIPAVKAEDSIRWIDGGNADRVHLRSEPSTASDSLGLYFTGTGVSLIDEMDDWARVMIGDVKGYIMADFLSQSQPVLMAPWQMVDNPSSTWVNLRERPSMSADILSFPDNGITVRVLGETADGWSYVVCEGIEGYMRTELLSPVKMRTTLLAKGSQGYIHRCIAPNGQELYFNAYAEEPVIEFKDVNFDGMDDLVIITGRWAKCDTALFYVYDPAEGYVLVRETIKDEGLMNYARYPEYGLVGASIANGNAGLCYEEWLYRWEDNDLECIRRAYSDNYTETVWAQDMSSYTQTTYTDLFVCDVYDYTTGVPEGKVIFSAGPLEWDAFVEVMKDENAALWRGLR